MDSTEPGQDQAGATQDQAGPEPAGKDCLICDRVLAAGGLVAALVLAYMSADLLTGGAITAALFGRRDPAVWDAPGPDSAADVTGAAGPAEGEAPGA